MAYHVFIDRYIHPFIIYVVAGTLICYSLALLLARLPGLRDSKSRTMLFTMPFFVPFFAYFLFRPYVTYNCILFKRPLGIVNSWLCSGASALATILTPLFFFVTSLAVFKALLSIIATRRMVIKYGFASAADHPVLFTLLKKLCSKAGIIEPRLIVTKDNFARSFTMGRNAPVIVFSEGLLRELDEEELETVLAHELGHIVSADSMLNWVMVFLRDMMFFTPLIYWIFNDLSSEKEKASDDFAIKLTDKPYAFAQALIKVWKLSPRSLFTNLVFDNFVPYPNFVTNSGLVEQRVKRILDKEHQVSGNRVFSYFAVIALVVSSLVIVYIFC